MGGIRMKPELLTKEEVDDIAELRNIVHELPEKAKVEIVKGMAMFEAGYKAGFVDAAKAADEEKRTAPA